MLFKQTRKAEDIYLFHKTGIDAGQTVPHWHMHLIVTANKTQGFFGKLTVLKNMLFGSSPMKRVSGNLSGSLFGSFPESWPSM